MQFSGKRDVFVSDSRGGFLTFYNQMHTRIISIVFVSDLTPAKIIGLRPPLILAGIKDGFNCSRPRDFWRLVIFNYCPQLFEIILTDQ